MNEDLKKHRQRLYKVIKEKSVVHKLPDAWKEWKCISTDYYDTTCACGHPIQEVFIIENINNGNRLEIGNVCIKHFEKSYGIELNNYKNVKATVKSEKQIKNCCIEFKKLLKLDKTKVDTLDAIKTCISKLSSLNYINKDESNMLQYIFIEKCYLHVGAMQKYNVKIIARHIESKVQEDYIFSQIKKITQH